MIVKSIHTLYNVWANCTTRTVYKVLVDTVTKKEYTEVSVYNFYDKKAQIKQEEIYGKLDIKA